MFNRFIKNRQVANKRQAVRGQRVNKRHTKKVTYRFTDALKKIGKLVWRPKLLSGLSIVFIGLLGYNKINVDNILPIQSVKIEGEFEFLNEPQLQKQALLAAKGGFFNVDLSTVRNALVDFPWVDNVSVRRQWPNTLRVQVMEKKPVVLWRDDGVISAKGELFKPRQKPQLTLPHLSGPQGQHKTMLDELARMQAWLLETGLTIKNIELNERRSWILTMTSGMELRLGREQMHERLNRFVSVYKETLETKMLKKSRFKNAVRKIKYVDMRYTNGFAVAWKEA